MADRERMPYIGISGVSGAHQQRNLELLWEGLGLYERRNLLLGVKAVHSNQWAETPNKYGTKWYPLGEQAFETALLPKAESYGAAQMYFSPEAIDADPNYPRAFVDRTLQRGRRWINAVQFDMLPYDQSDTRVWRDLFAHIHETRHEVIVQCHGRAMKAGPEQAIEQLSDLGPVDYILFDASHGKGVEMDPTALLPFLEAAHRDKTLTKNRTGFGVAGGLNTENVTKHLPSILSEFPQTSWDAEGNLHPRPLKVTSETGEESWITQDHGALNVGLAWWYMQASAKVIRDADKLSNTN
ncbi:MAG: hypothetical protein ABIP74_04970 [Candidatus Saccharimonas sp.]